MNPVRLDHQVHVRWLLIEEQIVLKSRAAAALHLHSKTLALEALFFANLTHFRGSDFSELQIVDVAGGRSGLFCCFVTVIVTMTLMAMAVVVCCVGRHRQDKR